LLTCKEFLQELNDYLDETVDPELRRRIEAHITQCPNCFVILDTTKKTIQVYKGVQPQTLPADVQARLLKAMERKLAEKKLAAKYPHIQA
jgi:anti-sigma factor RsiW